MYLPLLVMINDQCTGMCKDGPVEEIADDVEIVALISDPDAAAAGADRVFITSDNPRGEDPEGICAAVAEGARGGTAEVLVEPDRRDAIRAALRAARQGDVVLIAGKGHETHQEIAGEKMPFDDRLVVVEELEG